jgi:hypothetical protein
MTVAEKTEKRCSTCGETKPLSEFYRSSTTRDGRQYRCKPCDKQTTITWQRENRDRYADRMRRWRRENPDATARDRAQSDAYQAAETELRERHRDEFDALYAEEKAKRGLA